MRAFFSCLFVMAMAFQICVNADDSLYLRSSDIEDIYEKYVKINYNLGYRIRYAGARLPLHKNTGPWKWEGKDFPRVIAVLEFQRFIEENQIAPQKTLGVEVYPSDGVYDPEYYALPCKNFFSTNYQTNPEKHDLHNLQLDESDFDFVMLNQVLEHTYDPIRCLKNLYPYMKEGGILYINVPVLNIPHDTPWHYYTGYTPTGLGAVVKAAGFEILEIGQWGNSEYIHLLFQDDNWPDYRALENPGLNEIEHPVIAWIFAVKRGL